MTLSSSARVCTFFRQQSFEKIYKTPINMYAYLKLASDKSQAVFLHQNKNTQHTKKIGL